MSEIIRNFEFDVNFGVDKFERTDGSSEVITIVENDNRTTKFKFNFVEKIPNGTNVLVKIKHNTGFVKEYILNVQNQTAELILTNSILVAGTLKMTISYIGSNNEILTATQYQNKILVKESLTGETVIPEEDENLLEALISQVNLLNQETKEATQDADQATENANNAAKVSARTKTEIENTFEQIQKAYQQQIDTDASLELASARTNKEGITYSNLKERLDSIETTKGHIYGVRRKITNNSSSTWEVLDDRKGLNVNATLNGNTSVVNELYNFSPYKDIKICDYDITSMRVNAYYGDPTFKFDGSNGDVYVFIPDTYIKEYEDNDYHYISISDVPRAGFKHYESFYISKYLIQVIDGKARSYSGLKPTTQITIANARTAATANGSRFCLLDLDAVTVIQDLFLVMFANTNCQSKCGYGVTDGFTYTALIAETSVNRMIVSDPKLLYVGKTINIGKAWWDISIAKQRDVTKIEDYKDGDISGKAIYFDGDPVNIAVGNAIWSAGQTAGQTDALGMVNGTVLNDHEHSVNLFGIENFWSNLYQFVDGVTHYKNKLFVCNDHSQYANEKMTSPYKQLNYEVCASEGWVSKMGYDVDMPEYKFPTENKASDSTYWSDYYYVNPNAKNLDTKYLARLGGCFCDGSGAGLFCWVLSADFGWSHFIGGARVLIRNQ